MDLKYLISDCLKAGYKFQVHVSFLRTWCNFLHPGPGILCFICTGFICTFVLKRTVDLSMRSFFWDFSVGYKSEICVIHLFYFNMIKIGIICSTDNLTSKQFLPPTWTLFLQRWGLQLWPEIFKVQQVVKPYTHLIKLPLFCSHFHRPDAI